MLIFYVIPFFLISGTSIFLFFMSVSPKIKAKNLSLIIICLAINLLTIPISCLVGSFVSYTNEASTEFTYNNPLYFWKGFFFIQIIPLFVLFVALIWWLSVRAKKKSTHRILK
ncbi:ethanolamine transporter EutH [Bacillus sp. RC242]